MPDRQIADDRIIRETGLEARIAGIVIPVLSAAGYRLVRVHLSGQDSLTLQIMAEQPDGSMTVEDCEIVTRAVSPVLDVEDPIDRAYELEVSSPGIDRPLVRIGDFEAAVGHTAKMETSVMVGGRKRFRGRITEVTGDKLLLEREKVAEDEDPTSEIPLEAIGEAKLVLTDDLIREALRKEKKERQQLKKARRGKNSGADA
ncbi:ribosome maturation factor RimP [Chelativorans sp. YIM 93263]|uniref:ribosome maturation factor RimP n=1 Tax=Chelativorans sp. YIM 93263 TaxID=2906648 RepID=UPI00237894BE|nr:ribosome maturation factor RimP [Chelativorans sp. YIM 93263]